MDNYTHTLPFSDYTRTASKYSTTDARKAALQEIVASFGGNIAQTKARFAEYNADVRAQKEAAAKTQLLTQTNAKLDALQSSIETEITSLNSKVMDKMFPLTKADKMNGYAIKGLAYNFFALAIQNEGLREACIYDPSPAIANGLFDYYSYLIEIEQYRTGRTPEEVRKLATARKSYIKLLGVGDYLGQVLELSRVLEDMKFYRSVFISSPDRNETIGEALRQKRLDEALKLALNELS